MLDAHALIKKIAERNCTKEELSAVLGINPKVFDKKLQENDSYFTIKEVESMVQILRLSGEEAIKIFFADVA